MKARETSRRMLEAWNKRDWTFIRDHIHPDCQYTGPDGKVTRGIERCMKAAWSDIAGGFPDGKVTLTNQVAEGDTVVTECRMKGTHTGEWEGIPPTGKVLKLDFLNVMQFKDGKLFRERDYIDTLSLFVTLGVIEAPETEALPA